MWLGDAHAMETTLEKVLTEHAENAKEHPEIKLKIEAHLAQTKEHARKVEDCIAQLGEKIPAIKKTFAAFAGMLRGKAASMAEDFMVRNAVDEYMAEHLEIASYTAIIVAANELGEGDIAEICEEILEEEREMADWLEDNLPGTVLKFFGSDELEVE